MKFIINREDLLLPLQQIVNVIEKRQTSPILSNVLVIVEDDVLKLTGTDLEIQIVAKINISPATSGSTTVPARKFFDICKLLPTGSEIKFELQDNKIKISSARSKFTLNCLPADNFPDFPEFKQENQLSINAGKLKKALEKTLFCMANQDARLYLNGALFSVADNKLKLVASDGYRLSIYEDTIDEYTGSDARIVFPRKGIIELSRMINDPEAELKIEFSTNNIKVFIKNMIFSAKLMDSKYPDFGKIYKQEFFDKIEIQKQTLKDALTRVAILSNEKFKGVTLDITSGQIKISTHNPEHDEAEEDVFIEYKGNPISIAFNGQYLLDAISNLDSDVAVLSIAKNLSTCFIDEKEECAYTFITMPMRI